ncbi:MAG: PEP-CTERM sorting domain-containing protein [Anaerolineae bacterium]|nr:PEP-CTERM sorting domain-containing protein [Gloeobacterales cyanobacterium ES-bin-313]
MRLASLPLAALASLSLLLAAPAQAALLVDPVGGTPVTFDDADEGSSGPVNLGFTFNFFGTNYSQVYVNTNGNLSFGGANPGGFNPRLGVDVTFPLIAAFYDDLVVGANGSVSYLSTANQFVVTWNNLDVFLGATEAVTAQAVLGADGSVVFSYGNLSSDGEATIGITNGLTGSNAQFASLSYLGTNPDGTILDSELSLLSTADSFVPVPEPSSALSIIGLGLFGGAFFRRRRQA